jgi:hypothetical protein
MLPIDVQPFHRHHVALALRDVEQKIKAEPYNVVRGHAEFFDALA